MEEISQENLNKTSKEANLEKLREEFSKKSFTSEKHPKTSHKYKHSIDYSNHNNNNINKKFYRTNKAFSANKFNLKWGNPNKFNDKKLLDFYRKNPGYLYYKEIVSNMKSKQFLINQKRAFTGKEQSKRINFGHTNYNHFNNKNSDKLPKIGKTKKKAKTQYFKGNIYNINYNNYNYNSNLNYNYNINNININIRDKKNPYSLSWVNKILNPNDYRLEVKEITNGVPKLVILNKKDEIIQKIYNNNKLYINNYMQNEKDKKEKDKKGESNTEKKEKEESNNNNDNNNDNNENNNNNNDNINKDNNNDNDNNNNDKDNDNDDLDEEQQMQFYKNQKNFFKARKDIKEEPEDLEEDNDENKDNDKIKFENINEDKPNEYNENKV